MRGMKFAVVLCFTAALIALGNYPQPVTVHGAAPRALPRFTDGSGPASTNFIDTSAVICANCHSNINHIAPLGAIEIRCEDCHGSDAHGMAGATSAYHISLAGAGDCMACHSQGGYGMEISAYHTSFAAPMPMH